VVPLFRNRYKEYKPLQFTTSTQTSQVTTNTLTSLDYPSTQTFPGYNEYTNLIGYNKYTNFSKLYQSQSLPEIKTTQN